MSDITLNFLEDNDICLHNEEIKETEMLLVSLEAINGDILNEGVSKETVRNILFFSDENDANKDYPIASFTDDFSNVNIDVALESLFDGIVKGLNKLIELVFKILSKFFDKLGDAFKWFSGKINSDIKEEKYVKKEAIITAMQRGLPEVKTTDGFLFENKINKTIVTSVITEKLLMSSFKDSGYRNIKEIMEIYYKKDLTDLKWEEIVNTKSNKMAHLNSYVINWWNSTHPIASTHNDIADIFVNQIAESIGFTLDSLDRKIIWWSEKIKKLIGSKESEFDQIIEDIDIGRRAVGDDDLDKLKNDLKTTFKLIDFIKTEISNEIVLSLKNALASFKVAKVTPKSKMDFAKSLNEIEWVYDIKDLSSKVKKGKKRLENVEKDFKEILEILKKKYKGKNRKIVSSVNKNILHMKEDCQTLISITVLLLSFMTSTESYISSNRTRSAGLHEFLVNLGISIEKTIKEN